jgi:hypothetical protein
MRSRQYRNIFRVYTSLWLVQVFMSYFTVFNGTDSKMIHQTRLRDTGAKNENSMLVSCHY